MNNPEKHERHVGAVAVDVNVHRETGFRRESELLNQLAQFQISGISMLLPEIWEREFERHWVDYVAKSKEACRRVDRISRWASSDLQAVVAELVRMLNETSSPEDVVRGLILARKERIGGISLRTAWDRGGQVLDDYFCCRAPFEKSGQKRKEFPDALALVSLDKWGEEHDRNVIVVTKDNGCLKACERLEFLVGTNTVSNAWKMVVDSDERLEREAGPYMTELGFAVLSKDGYLVDELQSRLCATLCEKPSLLENVIGVPVFNLRVEVLEVFRTHPFCGSGIGYLRTKGNELDFAWNAPVSVKLTGTSLEALGSTNILRDELPLDLAQDLLVDVETSVKLQSKGPMSPSAVRDSQLVSMEVWSCSPVEVAQQGAERSD